MFPCKALEIIEAIRRGNTCVICIFRYFSQTDVKIFMLEKVGRVDEERERERERGRGKREREKEKRRERREKEQDEKERKEEGEKREKRKIGGRIFHRVRIVSRRIIISK